jgi:hypothetical protein
MIIFMKHLLNTTLGRTLLDNEDFSRLDVANECHIIDKW